MKQTCTTSAPVIAGQGHPAPVSPPGNGWVMQGVTPSKDDDGKPCLTWTWARDTDTDQDDDGEFLTQ